MKITLRWIVALAVLGGLAAFPAVALDLQLKDKIVLVTGSTSNIGYATARLFMKEGATVIINSNQQAAVDEAVAKLTKETGRKPLSFTADVTKAEDIARLVAAHPRVDVLVNNVGGMIPAEFLQSTDKQWDDSWQLNVMSGVRLSRHYLPGMRERNWGRIVFISSESGLQIPTESIAYGAVKAAVIATARGLAEINAGTGITVNSVLPGPTWDREGPRAKASLERSGAKTFDEMEKTFLKDRRPTSIIQRFGSPDEVAALIVYTASGLASATTGAALRVDGGVVKSAF
ncbi:MAG TPA: SDR family oxidoreductase [Steroidobacteraceae bacterium]|jgi:NAD(P)-dependent dehydrogenase (short-subunit alcohol dehydrogenase family)|nr:SDR family oxidoreductase [Steroidobacteraceae bacterium]